jgi:hypothetical protein
MLNIFREKPKILRGYPLVFSENKTKRIKVCLKDIINTIDKKEK